MNRPVTLGLISDTHIPDRWKALPSTVFDIFQGVDLILHAGDVGELAVLDQLGQIAPVVAVHGNDELIEETVRALPFHQVIPVAGRRIFVTHGNNPDFEAEMAMRQSDSWHVSQKRLAALGRESGASIVVYGHSHIPMAIEYEGIWLVNPGGIASGNHTTRQTIQTVAKLTFQNGISPSVQHVDLNDPGRPVTLEVNIDEPFSTASAKTGESIVTPDVDENKAWVAEHIYPFARDQVRDVMRRLMYDCLEGKRERYSTTDVLTELAKDEDLPDEVRQKIEDWFGPLPL